MSTNNNLQMKKVIDNAEKLQDDLFNLADLTQIALKNEIDEMRKIRENTEIDNNTAKQAFESFAQKATQLFNILSTVLKSMKEMESSVVRNVH